MITWNKKLVRDKIPERIDKTGVEFRVIEVGPEAMLPLLFDKLKEEVEELEFANGDELNELADCYEVLYAIAAKLGIDWVNVLEVARDKHNRKGGFDKGFYLLYTDDHVQDQS